MGIRIDVQNTAIRLLLNFVLSLLCSAIVVFIHRVLLGLELHWNWLGMLFEAIGNSVIALLPVPAAGPVSDARLGPPPTRECGRHIPEAGQ